MRRSHALSSALLATALSALLVACGSTDTSDDADATPSTSSTASAKTKPTSKPDAEGNPACNLLDGETLTTIVADPGLTFRQSAALGEEGEGWACVYEAAESTEYDLAVTFKQDNAQGTVWKAKRSTALAADSEPVDNIGEEAYRTVLNAQPPAYTAHKGTAIFAAQGASHDMFTDEQLVAIMQHMADRV